MPQVIHYICNKLESYDTSSLEWIKLLPLNKNHLLHGCCQYPVRDSLQGSLQDSCQSSLQNSCQKKKGSIKPKSGYRIRASVNVEMAPPFTYQHWARIPSNNYKQGWYSGEKTFVFEDLEECAVHTLAHECFHYLSHSKQTEFKNTEANANWWADQWLDDYHTLNI